MWEIGTLTHGWWNVKWVTMENNLAVHQKFKHRVTVRTQHLNSQICIPKRNENIRSHKTHTQKLRAVSLVIAKKLKQFGVLQQMNGQKEVGIFIQWNII